MNQLAKLSRREREIMEIVFAAGEATVTQIRDRMENAPTRPALRSLLGILEDKGQLTHSKFGREFVYQPTQSREQVGRSVLDRAVDTFFGGSLEKALVSYLGDPKADLTTEELDELEKFIAEAKSKRASKTKTNKAKKK
ncbi:MAG: BlaI/MecI/CopY family transcriptional regulator [Verrucomicrobiota bacterium]